MWWASGIFTAQKPMDTLFWGYAMAKCRSKNVLITYSCSIAKQELTVQSWICVTQYKLRQQIFMFPTQYFVIISPVHYYISIVQRNLQSTAITFINACAEYVAHSHWTVPWPRVWDRLTQDFLQFWRNVVQQK